MQGAGWILLGLAPGLLWVVFFRHRGRWSVAESTHALWAFVLGGVSALGVFGLRPLVEGLAPTTRSADMHRLVDAFVVTAPLEEALKAAAVAAVAGVLTVVRPATAGFGPRLGLILGLAAGLGFASAENAHYLLALDVGLEGLAARAFTSTLLHASATAALGFFAGWAARYRGWSRLGLALGGVAVAWASHGAFTLGTIVGGWPFYVGVLAVLPAMLVLVSCMLRSVALRPPAVATANYSDLSTR